MDALQAHTDHAPAAIGEFLPHGYCYLWNTPLLLTHVTSDLLIGVSYLVISFALGSLVYRLRKDIPFSRIFVAFGLFIVACGLTHFMEVWTLWQPVYWLSGGVKVVTAMASVATAFVMPSMVPRVHATIRDAKVSREREVANARAEVLEEANAELQRVNASLQAALTRAEDDRGRAEQAQKVAEEANAAKSDFLAVMSHELRTPLNAVLGYTELLQLGIGGSVNETQGVQLERIRSSGTHLVSLIDQVLGFARLEANGEEIRIEPVDAVALAQEVAGMVAPLASSKGLSFEVLLPAGPIMLESDPQRLRQIVLNLLSNAIKFTDEGSVTLTVSARDPQPPGIRSIDDESVEFRVRDTGIGIAPEHRDRIFEPFWRAAPTLTRTTGGTGLGLSVSARLARLLGARLALQSVPGEGSTFVLSVPRARGAGGDGAS